jgi:hypothetical protein
MRDPGIGTSVLGNTLFANRVNILISQVKAAKNG